MSNDPLLHLMGAVAVILAMAAVAPASQALECDREFVNTPHQLGLDEFQVNSEVLQAEIGQRHEITGVPLPGHGSLATLAMERFRVFAPDAKIVIHSADGDFLHPIPKNRYYRGKVAGEPDSTVVMTVLEDGEARGLVVTSGRHWVFSGNSINKSLSSTFRIREIEPTVELEHDAQGFECGTDNLQPLPPLESTDDLIPLRQINLKTAAYTAKIAVETDNEFFNLFGNTTDATNYVADIIAFGSTVYSAQVSTSWLLQHLSLWPTGTPDPWSQTSTACGLYEFGKYWNDNNTGITRTIAHFMSGKNNGGGIAWLGVLCYPAMSVTQGCPGLLPAFGNYAGGYGYSGDLDGNFDFNNPAVVWDIVAVTHEIGHNFDSPHTHCYAGLEGNANQIDQCYSGEVSPGFSCHSGTTSLPSGCPGGGNGCGTIMSYCHALSGGINNIGLTLGEGHPYGTEPGRVPTRMAAHVASRAAASPGCLDYVNVESIFSDDFESGNTNAWSSTGP